MNPGTSRAAALARLAELLLLTLAVVHCGTGPGGDASSGAGAGAGRGMGGVVADEDDTEPPPGLVGYDASRNFFPRIRRAFDARGGTPAVGLPVDNGGGIWVHAWSRGRVQDFDGGRLGPVAIAEPEWNDEAYVVFGGIRTLFMELGGSPVVGFPLENPQDGPHGPMQRFEQGCIGPDGGGGFTFDPSCAEPPDLGPVLALIQARAAASTPGTDFGVAVEWLPTGQRWGVRADEARNSASSAKFIWAAAALTKSDIAVVEPSAIPTFRFSDNVAAGRLIDLAGGIDAVNDFMASELGIPSSEASLCGWSYGKTRVASRCSRRLRGDNFFTPNAAVTFLERVWQGLPVADERRDKLLEWSTLAPRSGYGGWIGTQLPVGERPFVHHKAGWLPNACCGAGQVAIYNEIGIVPTPRGKYAVALSMSYGASDAAMIRTLEWASCLIWHTLAMDDADPTRVCRAP